MASGIRGEENEKVAFDFLGQASRSEGDSRPLTLGALATIKHAHFAGGFGCGQSIQVRASTRLRTASMRRRASSEIGFCSSVRRRAIANGPISRSFADAVERLRKSS